MGQGYSLLTGSLDPLPGYAPRASSPVVDYIFVPMPSATASDGDFTDAVVDRTPSTASSHDRIQLNSATRSDDTDVWNNSQYSHSRSPSNADVIERRLFRDHFQHRTVAAANPPPIFTSQNADVTERCSDVNNPPSGNVDPMMQYRETTNDNMAAVTHRMSSHSRQFIKKSDNQLPIATNSQRYNRTSIERCSTISESKQSTVDNRRTSQLTENLKNNLERLLQRNLNQHHQSSGNRNHSEDHPPSRRLHRIVAGGLQADKLNKTVKLSSHDTDHTPARTDCDVLDGEILDLLQFAPAEVSQASHAADNNTVCK
jgi:hypothetical protein